MFDNIRRIDNDIYFALNNLTETMLVCQIDYWLNIIKNSNDPKFKEYHTHYGKLWVYKTCEEWQVELPYFSLSTIKRAIKSLKEKKIIISDNFNQKGYDRTAWYTIDYDTLETLINTHSVTVNQCKVSQRTDAKCQSETTNTIDYSETSSKDYIKCTMLFSGEKRVNYDILKNQIRKACRKHGISDTDYMQDIIVHFFKTYETTFGRPHPYLKTSQLENIIEQLYYGTDIVQDMASEDYKYLIDEYFQTDYDCDYNLNHFATPGILDNLFYKNLY